jgi:pimeloyl-ACP methyl ester carboxylesterase
LRLVRAASASGGLMGQKGAVVLISGAWVTPWCWRYFEPLLRQRGFRTLAPAWPCKDRPIEDQRSTPDPRLARTGIPEVVEHFKSIVGKQAVSPILIGHSFGGLIVQLLLNDGFGAAGIAISSVPPRGVSLGRLFSRKTLKQLRTLFRVPFSWRNILRPPVLDQEQQAFLQANGRETHLVPESGRIFWQLFSSAARVDFRNGRRPPLLLIGCGRDHCVPAEIQRRNFERYAGSGARTDFAAFPELSHFSIAETGCEALAGCCAAWAEARLREREIAEVQALSRRPLRLSPGDGSPRLHGRWNNDHHDSVHDGVHQDAAPQVAPPQVQARQDRPHQAGNDKRGG